MTESGKKSLTATASAGAIWSWKLVFAVAVLLMMVAGLIAFVPAQAEDRGFTEADMQHQAAMRHLEETRNEIRLMQAHGIGMGTGQ